MKTEPDMVTIAKNFAQMAHTGQFRRDGKTPYFNHVDGVARIVSPQKAEYIATAYLHDVIEDTSYNHFDLIKIGMPKMVVNAVLILTKFKNQSYDDYLKKVKETELKMIFQKERKNQLKHFLAKEKTNQMQALQTIALEIKELQIKLLKNKNLRILNPKMQQNAIIRKGNGPKECIN
jgi:(p)ppGpp synthase/HD superfamily hydrolase